MPDFVGMAAQMIRNGSGPWHVFVFVMGQIFNYVAAAGLGDPTHRSDLTGGSY